MQAEKTDKPKVSIIVPNYNYSQYLDNRMKSILEQRYQDFEIIILDDASTDGSEAVIEKYRSNSRVSRIEYNRINTGKPCAQWKKGWELASGEYVWIAEADDLSSPDFLETAIAELDKDKDSLLYFSLANIIDSNGTETPQELKRFNSLEPDFRLPEGETCYRFSCDFFREHYLVWRNTTYNASGIVFRKDSIEEEDWNKCLQYSACGDWMLWCSLCSKKGKVIIDSVRRNYFRIHDASTTKQSVHNYVNHKEALMIFDEILQSTSSRKRKIIIGNFWRGTSRFMTGDNVFFIMRARLGIRLLGKEFIRDAVKTSRVNHWLRHSPWGITAKKDHRKRDR